MHYAEFQKNLMEQFQENFRADWRMDRQGLWINSKKTFRWKDRQREGRMDGWQIQIHRILPAAAGDLESYAQKVSPFSFPYAEHCWFIIRSFLLIPDKGLQYFDTDTKSLF